MVIHAGLLNPFWVSPLFQHDCSCFSTPSLPVLVCKLSSRVRVDRFLGKSDGLINDNAKDVGASVIGAL